MRVLSLLSALLVRFVLLVAIFMVPFLIAGFAEWSINPAGWYSATRFVVSLCWCCMAAVLGWLAADVRKGRPPRA